MSTDSTTGTNATNDAQVSTPAATAEKRGIRKVRFGRVVSDKMDKTVVVSVANLVRHRLYGKTIRRSQKFKVHDETNDAHVGDTVEIMETRPISRDKCWRIVRIVERAK